MHGRSESSFENYKHRIRSDSSNRTGMPLSSISGSADGGRADDSQPIDSRIDAYFDGDLNIEESCKIIQDLARNPHNFEKIVKEQAWIDELKSPVEVPDVTPSVMKRLGLNDKDEDSGRRSAYKSHGRLSGLFVTRGVFQYVMVAGVTLALTMGWWLRSNVSSESHLSGLPVTDSSSIPLRKVFRALTEDISSPWQLSNRVYDEQQHIADSIAPLSTSKFNDFYIINDDILIDKTRAMLPTPNMRNNTFASGNGYTRYSKEEIDEVMNSKLALFTFTDFPIAPPLPATTYPEIPGKVEKPEYLQSDSR